MTNEYTPLPPEYCAPSHENARIPKEHIQKLNVEPEKKRRKISKFKAYCISAIIGVSAVTATAEAAPMHSLSPEADYLADFPMAYYTDSAEECERMVEDELWYQVFGELPEFGYTAPFYGSFESRDDLREAVVLESAVQQGGEVLSLPYYNYKVELSDGDYQGKIYVLPDAHCAVLRMRQGGEFVYELIEPDEIELNIPYDVENGDAQIRAFGNGSDIVGFWDMNHPKESVTFHVTSEHTQSCGKEDIGILVTLNNR